MPKPTIAYVHPTYGGIGDYAKIVGRLYKQRGFDVHDLPFADDATVDSILSAIGKAVVVHFEIGGGQSNFFQASRQLASRHQSQIVTLHDPGVIVGNPSGYAGNRLFRKIANTWVRQFQVPGWLRSVTVVYLRRDLASPPASYYLPQPTYHEKALANTRHSSGKLRIGFGGYWGVEKGVQTVVAAWGLLDHDALELIMAGGSTTSSDAFTKKIKAQLAAKHPEIQLPGFISDDKFDEFITSLDVAVVPYWPELPVGSSAMAMRIAELGIPIIASDIPALRAQLEQSKTIFVAPKDPAALAEGIKLFAKNPEMYQEASVEFQTQLFAEHDWATVGAQLEKIIVATNKPTS